MLRNFNFAVPTEKTLAKHVSKSKINADHPGVLQHSVETFANAYGEVDCKISLNGKKIAYGFGKKIGDENICGHEEPPTLPERQKKYENEQGLIAAIEKELIEFLEFLTSDSDLQSLPPPPNVASIKEKLLCTIQVGNQNIRDLRELVL